MTSTAPPDLRVGRSLPELQDDVCFHRLPPAFAAVPQYLVHTPVELLPLSEPDLCGAYGYGKSDTWRQMLGARCRDTGAEVEAGVVPIIIWGRACHPLGQEDSMLDKYFESPFKLEQLRNEG